MKKLDLNNMSKKDLNKIHTYLRAVIQLLYFIFIPSVYTAAFSGVKYIFTQIGTGDKIDIARQTSALGLLNAYELSGIDQITGDHVFQFADITVFCIDDLIDLHDACQVFFVKIFAI